MELEIATVSVMTAVVVVTAGILFIVETVLREDDAVGRTWSIASSRVLSRSAASLAGSALPNMKSCHSISPSRSALANTASSG